MELLSASVPSVGLAYSSYVDDLVVTTPDLIDFVEMPFELLRANPGVASIGVHKPLILHSASLSMAGDGVSSETFQSVGRWIEQTATPWLGEHLAFVSATAVRNSDPILLDDDGEAVIDIGYAVGPAMNDEVVSNVVAAVEKCAAIYPVPTLLENAPVYFDVPGSSMNQAEFIGEICARSPAARLLLDLSHLFITARRLKADPIDLMLKLPLDRVMEVHLSGVATEDGQDAEFWDDHTVRAPEIVHKMLAHLLPRTAVRALTLEYNWSVNFPRAVLAEEIARVRSTVASVG
jgi:uncharacterized protein (UPF0276 family)